jgi:Putative metal-binding motif/FG-GAP repeat
MRPFALLLALSACRASAPPTDQPGDTSTGDTQSDDSGGGTTGPTDADGDGYDDTVDCDDGDASVHPDAEEICGNKVDEDCDGEPAPCGWLGEVGTSEADLSLQAEAAYDDAGRLIDAGDLTGDGQPELVVATMNADGFNGGAWVVDGETRGSHRIDTVGFEIVATATSSGLGRSVGIGDTDGDGIDDLLLGAPWSTEPSAWLFLGPITGAIDTSAAHAHLYGDFTSYTGHGSDLGDVTGDGYADAIVGAYNLAGAQGFAGMLYVQRGPLSPGDAYMPTDADIALQGERVNSRAARAVVGGQDMTGDGIGDMVVPAIFDSSVYSYGGGAFVVHGPVSSGLLGEAAGWFTAESVDAYAGYSVGQGDVDGDGLSDALVGAPYDQSRGAKLGAAYVLLGPASGRRSLGEAEVVVRGSIAGQEVGASVHADDADGDGLGELLVGAAGDPAAAKLAGAALLFEDPWGGLNPIDADAVFLGEVSGGGAGHGGGFADLDGDGLLEVLLGAPTDPTSGVDAGAAFVFVAR